MDSYGIAKGDKVLFVGEGNFSLCNDLISSLSEADDSRVFTEMYASCFEERESACITNEVEDNLKSKGVKLLFGVDATLLPSYPSLSSQTFNKIIFNFPHVGGKMKIQLNRALLKNYFISAEKLLAPNGRILVTLCAGQGGTSEEVKPRRYDDTWKVVEMASEGNLVLNRVQLWPAHLFPNYRPIGFRSTLRAFHTEGALIHEFSRGIHFETYLEDASVELLKRLVSPEGANDVKVAPCIDRLIKKSPFLTPNSPQNVLMRRLTDIAAEYSIGFTLPLTKGDTLRESLCDVIPSGTYDRTIFYGLVFSKISKSFDRPLASCEILIIGDDAEDAVNRLSETLKVNLESIWARRNSDIMWTIYLDELCSLYFTVNKKQLWASGVFIDEASQIHLPSLCSTRFVYDISFESEGSISEDSLWYIMHQLPDDIIDTVNPVSIYYPEGSTLVFNCYRISYISYDKALSKQRVIQYQRNVLGKALEILLNVKVR